MLALENHHLLGNCSIRADKNLVDRCKVLYQDKLSSININSFSFEKDYATSMSSSIDSTKPAGWALKHKKPKTTFTADQKGYLLDKFNLGIITGQKEDPAKVAKDMPYAHKNGNRRFKREEYLTATQVAGFFSRLSQKNRKCDAEDFLAASSDTKSCNLKEEVLSFL